MRLTAFCVGLLLAAPALQAQDISQHMADIGAGSYLVFDVGARRFTQVFRGPSGGLWVVDMIDGADPNGPRLSREIRNAQGQLVQVDYATGLTLEFTPHNCQRTLGPCLFIQTGPDGPSQQVRLTVATADGFSYESSIFPSPRSEPVLVGSGRMTLDALGSPAGGQITAQDGSVQQVMLVQAVYR